MSRAERESERERRKGEVFRERDSHDQLFLWVPHLSGGGCGTRRGTNATSTPRTQMTERNARERNHLQHTTVCHKRVSIC